LTPSTNELETKLIQVRLQPSRRQVMVNPQMQPLCIADGDVHPRVRLAGVFGRGLLRKVCLNVWFNACVSWICVGAHNGIRVQPPLHQLRIGHASMVGQVGHPQPTCGLSIRTIPGFNSDDHRLLPHVPAAAIEQAVTFFWILVHRETTIVQLDFAGKYNRFIHLAHRLADFLHRVPYRLMPLQPHPLLHLLGRNRLGCTGHQEHAGVPCMNEQLAVHHDCPAADGGLRATIQAFPSVAGQKPAHALRVTRPASLAICFSKALLCWMQLASSGKRMKNSSIVIRSV
jgi:hypothetical protein